MADSVWHLARGYRFGSVACGIRPNAQQRRDLALIVSDLPAAAAGVFTQNRVVAAPVQVSRQRVPTATARGVVVCSGNANACTGERGLNDARRMAAVAAEGIGCRSEQVLVCSTGIIGRQLPMGAIEPGIARAARGLAADTSALEYAAQAILTTDTVFKVATRAALIGGAEIHFTGFAKGAAMIGPNMATMLAFIVTDANVEPEPLQTILRQAVDQTFNCISVEGHTSTNDSVLLFANGMNGSLVQGADLEKYAGMVAELCGDLARAIIADAEGISKLIKIEVAGLRSDAEARQIAKAIAESALVKTAMHGADPNWGRIISAAGYAGVDFQESNLSLWLGEHLVYDKGTPTAVDAWPVHSYLKWNRELAMKLVFTLGQGRCSFWTCDLGTEYVRLNADYTT